MTSQLWFYFFQYVSSEEFIDDIRLLFGNARTFNEPGSQIYRDATTMESAVLAAYSSLQGLPLLNPLHMKSKYGLVVSNWRTFIIFSYQMHFYCMGFRSELVVTRKKVGCFSVL